VIVAAAVVLLASMAFPLVQGIRASADVIAARSAAE
jgi:hypothetical protein